MSPDSAAEIVSFPRHAKPVPLGRFVEAMGQAVTGVTIITAGGAADRAYGRPH